MKGVTREAGRCLFMRHGSNLDIQLPSGRRLHYPNARVEERIPHRFRELVDLPEKPKPTIVYDSPKIRGITTYHVHDEIVIVTVP